MRKDTEIRLSWFLPSETTLEPVAPAMLGSSATFCLATFPEKRDGICDGIRDGNRNKGP